MSNPSRIIDAQQSEISIMMLRQSVTEDEIEPLIDVPESIAADPRNEALLDRLADVSGGPGLVQGTVLTDAPYLSTVLSQVLFNDND
jgi:hypothetical protein